jgi:glycosyltransferase involved in cell wall biosynthesis
MPLLWQAPLFNFSGYGDEARAMILGMQHRGYPVTARAWGIDETEFVDQFAASAPDRLIALHRATQLPLAHPFVSVLHVPGYAATRVHGASANVIRTMFETDSIPPDWVLRMNLMDEVWTPTAFNAETFASAGVTAPIHVVPGGVDATLFRPALRPLRIPGTRGTVFLSIFEWAFRKGWDVLLSAWAEAFGPGDDVSLVLRTGAVTGTVGTPTPIEQRIDDHLALLGKGRDDVAPIIVLERPLSMADLPRLYAAADVYVSASRGEGWGRPLLEAMACRLPVVATRWSGNLAFMSDENSLLLDIEGLREVDHRAEFAFYRGHHWAEPSQAHLAEVLQRLAGDPALRKRIGARARSDVERHWQWKHVTQAVVDRVGALAETVAAPSGFGATSPVGSGVRPAAVRQLHVNWEGDFYAHHSLAGVNRALATRLATSGNISVTPLSREAPPFAPDTSVEVERIIRTLPPQVGQTKADVVVRLRWPPDLSSTGSTPLVLVQPWEYGGIPSAWMPQIQRHVSEVWCPSTWVKDCYVRSGVPESKVVVVPLGVDTDRFSPGGPVFPLATKKSHRLLFVGGTIPRKGIDVLLRSYLDTFSAHDDVCLVVKAFGSGHVYKGSTIDDQLRAVAEDSTSAEVELIDDELTEEQVPMLYRSCDVLVHPYRGEGFGLPVAEAMASGLPVVVTGYGACLDFCDEDNALFVPATESPIEMSDVGPSPIGYWWAEPDADALGRILRRVVDEPGVLDGLGAAGRKRILAGYTWDAAAAVASRRLLALTGRGPTA